MQYTYMYIQFFLLKETFPFPTPPQAELYPQISPGKKDQSLLQGEILD